MRRIAALVLVLVLICPVIASAACPEGDPYGASCSSDLTAPAPAGWLDSIVRALFTYLGI